MLRWLVAALLLVPGASAGLTLTVDPAQASASPDEATELTLTVTVDCTSLALRATGGQQVPATVQFTAPSYLLVTGPASILIPQCSEPALETSVQVTYAIGATHDAPGLQEIPVGVRAELPAHPADESRDEAELTFTAGYRPLFQVQSQVPLAKGGGPWTFPLDVTNFGNARSQFSFSTDAPDGVKINLPEDIVLDTPNVDGGQTDATVIVEVTKAPRGQTEIPITISVRSADVPDRQGEPKTINLLVSRGNLFQSIPGPGAPLVLLALALAARRRSA